MPYHHREPESFILIRLCEVPVKRNTALTDWADNSNKDRGLPASQPPVVGIAPATIVDDDAFAKKAASLLNQHRRASSNLSFLVGMTHLCC